MRELPKDIQEKIAKSKVMKARHIKLNLQNKVEAINTVNTMMNEALPVYRELFGRWLESGKKMTKVNGSFVKALADEFSEIREHFSDKYPHCIRLRYEHTHRVPLSHIRLEASKQYKMYRQRSDWGESESNSEYADSQYLLHGDSVLQDDNTYAIEYRMPPVYEGRTDYKARSVRKAVELIEAEDKAFAELRTAHEDKIKELKSVCTEYFMK